jgi:predicted N-acetyltransferase YhbS
VSASADGPQQLADGLVLRSAEPGDLGQIQALLASRGDPADARDFELMATDPDAGWELCAVVVDGDRVVSTASLLDEQVRLGGVELPAGQVELVATDPDYEGRGLVRALMSWAHQRSAARGHLLQVMIGIPYFYRLFGYGYAITIPAVRELSTRPDRPAAPDSVLRLARLDDVGAIAGLQADAQRAFDVTMPHSPPRQRWLLGQDSGACYVLERAEEIVATVRIPNDDEAVLLTEAAVRDEVAAHALLAHVAALRPGVPISVVDRPGTVADAAWRGWLAPVDPDVEASQYYLRVDDPAAVLDALRPVLGARLHGFAGDIPDEIVVSTFRAHYRMAVQASGLGAVQTGGALQAPGTAGGAGVAPDYVGALLCGDLGMGGLARLRPDVYPGPHRELFHALFPPLTADLLTFYLPY